MKRRATLSQRGYLYAAARVIPGPYDEPQITDNRRWSLADAWKAGYAAAKRDAKKKTHSR